jgi:hypothetical protein
MTGLTIMSDTELDQAIAATQQACLESWKAWEIVRDSGERSLWCPEFQAHQAIQATLSPLLVEHSNRDFTRKLALFGPPPMSGPDWDRAWFTGPGADAL